MNPHKVNRSQVRLLTDLPNVGPAMADDLRLLGIQSPAQLVGQSPFEMYERLCRQTGQRHDPCLCDCFIAAVRFMQGGAPTPWWHYTAERKRQFRHDPALSG